MPDRKYLFLQRSQPGNRQQPSPAQMQEMFAAFNAWKQKFSDHILDMGGKTSARQNVREDARHRDLPFRTVVPEFLGGSVRTKATASPSRALSDRAVSVAGSA